MNGKRIKIALVIAFLTIPLVSFAQISFKGNAPKAVVVGDRFQVNYTLTTNGEAGKDVRMPETDGLKVLYGPTIGSQSSSTSIINGSQTTQAAVTYVYVLLPEKEGEFTIQPATIKVGNAEYKSSELKIKVLPKDKAAEANQANARQQQNDEQRETASPSISGSDAFVRAQISKSSVYENEGFLVTFKLYTTVDIASFDNVKFPEFEGFVAQEIEQSQNQQLSMENYNGRNYRTLVLKQAMLFPQRSGKITIGQGKYDVQVRVRTQSGRSRSFFDFIDAVTNVKKTLTSAPVTIDVKPLPMGKPASFSGAVGDYKLTSSINTTTLKANEPITIKVVISGAGNIKMLKNPEIVFPNDFETYDPKVTNDTKVTVGGVTGTKTIEYYAVPRYAGDFVIPAAQLSYFDVKTNVYKTLATEEFKLHVEPGSGNANTPAPVVGASVKEDVRFVGADIRHIHVGEAHFQKGEFLFGTFGYWLWYLLPLLAFAVLFIIYRKQVAENANAALVRTKKANKVAARRLKLANQHLLANRREPFYDETLKAVWGYLSDKLNIPVANLTKDNVETELQRYGVSEQLISDFIRILNTAEFARFAPSQGHGAMDELYAQTVEAINQMERI